MATVGHKSNILSELLPPLSKTLR